MSEEMGNIIELVGEDGETVSLEHLDTLERDGETYMAFIPAEVSLDDSYELIILKIEQDEDGSELLVSLEDDELEDELFDIFSERLEDSFEDEDDEDSEQAE